MMSPLWVFLPDKHVYSYNPFIPSGFESQYG
jgi:hypothetical protein